MAVIDTKQDDIVIGKRLRSIRQHLGLTREDVYLRYGLSIETLKGWETGKARLTAKGLDRCIEIYKNEKMVLSPEWVITGNGLDPRLRSELTKIPLEGKTQKDMQAFSDFDFALNEVTFFRGLSNQSVVMQVSDSDMQPFYNPGDYVGGRYEADKAIWDTCVGKDCIVLDQDGDIYIRRLAKNHKNEFILTLHNPYWGGSMEPIISGIKIARLAQIIWHRRLLG